MNARVNASVISLYDSARLDGPQIAGEASDWATVDAAVSNVMQGEGRKSIVDEHGVVAIRLAGH